MKKHPWERKQDIMRAALRVAKREGYLNITRQLVSKECPCSTGLVSHYFGTIDNLRTELMHEAVRIVDLDVIAQGLAVNEHLLIDLDPKIKRAAALSLCQ